MYLMMKLALCEIGVRGALILWPKEICAVQYMRWAHNILVPTFGTHLAGQNHLSSCSAYHLWDTLCVLICCLNVRIANAFPQLLPERNFTHTCMLTHTQWYMELLREKQSRTEVLLQWVECLEMRGKPSLIIVLCGVFDACGELLCVVRA